MDFVVDYVNPGGEIGERRADEIVGRRFLELWPGTASSPIWAMYLNLMETGEPIFLDNFVYSGVIDGRAVTAIFEIRATRLGDGFLQNFRDVTERLPDAAGPGDIGEAVPVGGRRAARPVLHFQPGP